MILTPYGVPFHPVVVIGLGKNLLLKFVLGHCVLSNIARKRNIIHLTHNLAQESPDFSIEGHQLTKQITV